MKILLLSYSDAIRSVLRLSLLAVLWVHSNVLLKAEHSEVSDPSQLTLERIFEGNEFAEESFGPARWLPDSSGYVILEKSSGKAGGKDFVFYRPDEATGRVLIHSRHLIPAGETQPMTVEDYSWSHDGAYLLIFTNSRRVWRANTRGDYWVFDVTSHELRQLGGTPCLPR